MFGWVGVGVATPELVVDGVLVVVGDGMRVVSLGVQLPGMAVGDGEGMGSVGATSQYLSYSEKQFSDKSSGKKPLISSSTVIQQYFVRSARRLERVTFGVKVGIGGV